ncbi:sorting nexin-24-like [Saccoglossus kowalevskii]|uniref:Sorting nexin-24-like n=1 Tax=Saccoglossus kowalevskii TaxID=10224 RepID=A0ABM0LV92_SACKO|nr:PREDICTED: sorting nexin-24-like [Saccoglossus kowalevskii]
MVPYHKKTHSDSTNAYRVNVTISGRTHTVDKRYSECHALHKQLKKTISTPEFPPKRVRNWGSKVLEQRRQGLEIYLQALMESDILPKSLLTFLKISNLPSRSLSYDSLNDLDGETPGATHQPMLTYEDDPYLTTSTEDSLSDIITEGVKQGLYFDDNTQ